MQTGPHRAQVHAGAALHDDKGNLIGLQAKETPRVVEIGSNQASRAKKLLPAHDANNIRIQAVDLNAALTEVIKLFEQAHQEVEIKAALETKLPIFEFDRDQIKRVVINLMDNAVAALTQQPANGKPKPRRAKAG